MSSQKSVSSTTDQTDDASDLTKGEIFDVLRNQRRRYALEYLKREDGPTELGDMATQVAAWEYQTPCDKVSSDQRKRVYTTLQQTHLPKMDEAGIITYDSQSGVVERTAQTADLTVYLEIVPGREFAWREVYLAFGAVSCALVAALWGDVYPFTVVSDLTWATVIAVVFTVAAATHVYHERNMRLGDGDGPPELEFEGK